MPVIIKLIKRRENEMAKVVVIDRCKDCPYNIMNFCYRKRSDAFLGEVYKIDDNSIIPDWCPLPDAVKEGKVR